MRALCGKGRKGRFGRGWVLFGKRTVGTKEAMVLMRNPVCRQENRRDVILMPLLKGLLTNDGFHGGDITMRRTCA